MIKCVIMNVAALIRHITTKKIYIVKRKFYVPIYSRLAEGSVGFIVLDTGYAKIFLSRLILNLFITLKL